METLFSKIITGEIPSHKVYEDENFLAFLDISPRMDGHTLVIPKKHTDYIFDMKDDQLGALMVASKKVANILKEKLKCERVCVGVYGFEVKHVHVHLFPVNSLKEIPLPAVNKISASKLEETLKVILA